MPKFKHCQVLLLFCFNSTLLFPAKNRFINLLFLFVIILNLANTSSASTVLSITPTSTESIIFNDDITADTINDNGMVANAQPAVWGDPAPDYSATVLSSGPVYLYTLIFVDSKITRHYSGNLTVIKQEIMRMIKESNTYFSQLNMRISVVDVLQTMRDDLSLYTFQTYHYNRLRNLPYHDFAALISYRYAGGLAYVDGMCSYRNNLICGFYPHNPEAMGAIFFHETAHLLGVAHDDKEQPLNVSNCVCNDLTLAQEIYESEKYSPSAGCLKIPGFDHDCSAQHLANLLQRNRCLSKKPRSEKENVEDGYLDWSAFYDPALAMCGNGVVEGDEECDCGVEKFCNEINCIPETCKRKIPFYVIFLVGFFVCCIFLTLSSICCYFILKYISTKVSSSMRPSIRHKKWRFCKFAVEPLRILKRLCFSKAENKNRTPKNISNSFGQHEKLSTETIVTIAPRSIEGSTGTLRPLTRPQIAPPPPPTSSSATDSSSKNTFRPARPPPPVFSNPIRTAPPPPPLKPTLTACAIPTPPTATEGSINLRRNEVLWAEYEERISHKFADFGDECASDDEMF
jgi:hypothetical protein